MIRNERGVALVMVLIMLSVMTIIGLGVTSMGMVATTVTVNARETAGAFAIADAGIAHAKRLLLWQQWPTLNAFLQSGNGIACDGDELAVAPAVPLPPGFPAAASDFIPQAGVAFGGGTYRVLVCDDDVTDVDPATGALDLNPNADVNRRILVRAIGVGANGATATIEQVFGSVDLPAVIVNGNILATGNPTFMGAAGAIHANGSMEFAGNPCAQQYYSAVGAVTQSGGAAGGGATCTAAAVDSRPDSQPITPPIVTADTYQAQATYRLNANGTITNGQTGAAIAGLPSWTFDAATQTWSGSSNIPSGTYWVDGNVIMGGTPGAQAMWDASNGMPLTILARGSVSVGGSPRVIPHLMATGLGANPVGVSIIAGTDIQMAGGGGGGQTFTGFYLASHQVNISGSPTVNGQMIALNQADTTYPAVGGAPSTNLVQLNAAGQMVFTGTPNFNFAGNGAQALAALQWRECRTSNDPANPCGPLWGG